MPIDINALISQAQPRNAFQPIQAPNPQIFQMLAGGSGATDRFATLRNALAGIAQRRATDKADIARQKASQKEKQTAKTEKFLDKEIKDGKALKKQIALGETRMALLGDKDLKNLTAQQLGSLDPKVFESHFGAVKPATNLGKLIAARDRAVKNGNEKNADLFDAAIDKETKTNGNKPAIINLQQHRDALIAQGNKANAEEIQNRIDKLGAITGSTSEDPEVVDRVRQRALKKTKTSIVNAADLNNRLTNLLTNPDGTPNNSLVGLTGSAKLLLPGMQTQLTGLITLFKKDASLYSGKDSGFFLKIFDPKVGQSRLITNLLIYANAKANDPSGRVAKDDYKAEERALGANAATATATDILGRLAIQREVLTFRNNNVDKELAGEIPDIEAQKMTETPESIRNEFRAGTISREKARSKINALHGNK